jgi:hypothetical protein
MPRKKTRRASKKAKLLKRIERLARTAAVLRLRGNIARAMTYDKQLDGLFDKADAMGVDAMENEVRGRQRGDRLYHKIVKR